ncbi:RHS repeat-associated core domain protein [Bacteriovorax sp. BAL6_X]|uniref:RHS repeat domain-containing protein n=1 Tax=Bacteriovorax sp. BAL6_X TaxID=1201290 RepID=UPI000385CD2E|nr:RHS repeat-associated core domain-containing protein [Bacteriovorax sp. BAL6_X]EPZ51012.1 RHS repeat-associated core domain protein [Bacteriovorax sp. BAL6_X]
MLDRDDQLQLSFRNRNYNPSAGRFMSEDLIGVFGGYNVYLYAGNNPQFYIDPLGLNQTVQRQSGFQKSIAKAVNTLVKKLGLEFFKDKPPMKDEEGNVIMSSAQVRRYYPEYLYDVDETTDYIIRKRKEDEDQPVRSDDEQDLLKDILLPPPANPVNKCPQKDRGRPPLA